MKNVSTCLGTIVVSLMNAGLAASDPLPSPVTDDAFVAVDMREVELGRLLFWDPILSGNKNISCGTCHHPKFGTADGVSLSIGEGGIGLGPARFGDEENLPEQRIPRNAPALFNLGAHEFKTLFHDGRLEADETRKSGIRTPLDNDMLMGFSGVLSAQSMFPVLSADEMAGHYSENDVAKAVRRGVITGEGGAWDIISKRVAGLEEYQQGFNAFDAEIAGGKPIDFTDISDALAAFIAFEWRSDNSPFDLHLKGNDILSDQALAGMELFYGEAGCSACHSGVFQTDHQFHAMGVPQIGPGKAARFETHSQDTGRMRVTGNVEDAYAFRTPSLRNVTLTAPYGHSGAYQDLRTFVEQHLAPSSALENYEPTQALFSKFDAPKDDWAALNDAGEASAIALAARQTMVDLSSEGVDAIMAFLDALTDEAGAEGRLGIPKTVPSGLPIDH
ncbi:MAG: cytochrome c peroxidase [Pseudomonadota bacterium]